MHYRIANEIIQTLSFQEKVTPNSAIITAVMNPTSIPRANVAIFQPVLKIVLFRDNQKKCFESIQLEWYKSIYTSLFNIHSLILCVFDRDVLLLRYSVIEVHKKNINCKKIGNNN